MARVRRRSPVVMSKEEKRIVQYVVERLDAASRNSNGKPVYARNMDQVVHDIWGIKKFTKTLQKARYDESLMVQLMKAMDTQVLWKITRSKEHYEMLCSLVALDAEIVKETKKLQKLEDMSGTERPGRKMNKMAKDLSKKKKKYKLVVKMFRNIFGIERVGSGKHNSIMDKMDSWLDRYAYDDDIFYGYDALDDDGVESMDAFVRSMSKKGRKDSRASRSGALGLFDDGLDLDSGDIFSGFDSDDEDEDTEDLEDRVMQRILNRIEGAQKASRRSSLDDLGDELDEEIGISSDDRANNPDFVNSVLHTISGGFEQMSDQIGRLTNAIADLVEVEDDDVEESVDVPMGQPEVVTAQGAQREPIKQPVTTAEYIEYNAQYVKQAEEKAPEGDIDAPDRPTVVDPDN